MECTLCNKRYVGKAKTAINIRLNNHRKHTNDPNVTLAGRHFQQQGHNFNSHAKFIIIDKLLNTFISKGILLKRLIQGENFWIQKLKTLVPYRLNQELSKKKIKTFALSFYVHFYLDHSSHITLELRWWHNTPKSISRHVMINKFRISTNLATAKTSRYIYLYNIYKYIYI